MQRVVRGAVISWGLVLCACADAHVPAREASPDMRRELSRSSQGLYVEALPNGVHKIDLQGRFQHVAAVRNGQRMCLDRE